MPMASALTAKLENDTLVSLALSVAAVAASGPHAFCKEAAKHIKLIAGQGVDGDAHEGAFVQHLYDKARDPDRPNLRQVHLLEMELLQDLKMQGFDIEPGQLGENVTTRGLRLVDLGAGSIARLGPSAIIKITGLREPYAKIDRLHQGLRRAVTARDRGFSFMKRAVMAVVVANGIVRAGDAIRIIDAKRPKTALQLI